MSTSQLVILLTIGLLGGILSGSLGVGGGLIIVPALVYFVGFSQHMAQGTSLAVLLPPTGILAAMQYYNKGYIDIKVALILIITFVIGAYFGSLISINIPAKTLKRIFGVLVLVAGIKMVFGK